ncbi:MAG TPA: MBL fold metallo-hydrolase [Paracoccaceae bacterium]|nr:MBL fold metallo-hydrolase [Paracoccaceae bacterium]
MDFRPDRRTLLRLAALAPAFALPAALAQPLRAQLGAPAAPQSGGFFRLTLGAMPLTVISDGHLVLPTTVLGVNADRAEVLAFLEAHFESVENVYSHTNTLVVDAGPNRVLIDVGSGSHFQPTAGRLMANLALAAIEPASITHVAISHAHPDHLFGILDAEGNPVLTQAQVVIGAAEHGFWTAEGLENQFPQEMRFLVQGAVRSLDAVKDRLVLKQDGEEIVPGLRYMATLGHTPGHMSVVIESEDRRLLFTGDAVTHAQISFERPGWAFGFDADAAGAVATRQRLLEMAVAERMPMLGFHFPFPGIGHAVKDGDAYRFIPALWQWG